MRSDTATTIPRSQMAATQTVTPPPCCEDRSLYRLCLSGCGRRRCRRHGAVSRGHPLFLWIFLKLTHYLPKERRIKSVIVAWLYTLGPAPDPTKAWRPLAPETWVTSIARRNLSFT